MFISTPSNLIPDYEPPEFIGTATYEAGYQWAMLDFAVRNVVHDLSFNWMYDLCLVSFIPAPDANESVREAIKRFRIEMAVRGLDADL